MRVTRATDARQYEDHDRAGGRPWRVHAAGSGGAAGRSTAAGAARVRVAAGVLPRRCNADAVDRFRHQDRNLVAPVAMEWKVPGRRQRRVGRQYLLHRARGRRRGWLCDRQHRHRSRRQQRCVCTRSSREGHRLRVSIGARDDGQGESNHRRLLRHASHALDLEWLLAGRTPRHYRSRPVSAGFRRDYRRCTGGELDSSPRRAHGHQSRRERHAGQRDPAIEVPHDLSRRDRRLRRTRRRRRQRDRESGRLHLRSQGSVVFGCGG